MGKLNEDIELMNKAFIDICHPEAVIDAWYRIKLALRTLEAIANGKGVKISAGALEEFAKNRRIANKAVQKALEENKKYGIENPGAPRPGVES